MSLSKAILIFDPQRRAEQYSYVSERTSIIYEYGGQAWVAIPEEQAQRFSEQGILVQVFEDADYIDVSAASFKPDEQEAVPPSNLTATAPSGDTSAYYIVKFIAPNETDWLDEVEETGAAYVEDLPVHAAIFRMTAAQAQAARELDIVSWVGLYHPAYALSYELAGREEAIEGEQLHTLQIDATAVAPSDDGNVEISFFDDVDLASKETAISQTGASVVSFTGYSYIVNADSIQLTELLRIVGVSSIESYAPSALNIQRAGMIVGANQVRDFRQTGFLTNLDGDGETAGVIDSGFDAGIPPPVVHSDLNGRIEIRNLHGAATAANTTDNERHGTVVTGIIAGNGNESAIWGAPPLVPTPHTIPRGIAPRSRIIIHALRNLAAPNALNFNFGHFFNGLEQAHDYGARVHNNSLGRYSTTAPTNNPYSNNLAGRIDRFAYLHPESLVIFASGNTERDTNPKNGLLDARHLTHQASAKNILTIGATENETAWEGTPRNYRNSVPSTAWHNHATLLPESNAPVGVQGTAGSYSISDDANEVALFSCRGRVNTPGQPAERRRVKPDLVAPGTNIIGPGPRALLPAAGAAAIQNTNTAPNDFYFTQTGTSFAAPIVAGAAVLTRQYYRMVHAQLRRPTLLQHIARFENRPTIAAHRDGYVCVWVRPDGANRHIVAARFNHDLERQGNIVQLQANVGDHASPMLARYGDNTLLLHRANDNTLRLSSYDQNLSPRNSAPDNFGTNGVVTLAPASRAEATRLPSLCVRGDEVAVVWNQTGGNNLLMCRFNANNGSAIGGNITLGQMTNSSSHPFIVHNGTHYAIAWIQHTAGNYHVKMRYVNNDGTLVGAQPFDLHQQAEEIREAHLCWAANNRFLIAWIDTRAHPNGGIYSHLVNANGTGLGTPSHIVTVAAGNTQRRPFVARRPGLTGNMLLWEDNSQRGDSNAFHFDVYFVFLNVGGLVPGFLDREKNRISDTPFDTEGFSVLVDRHGIAPIWQSRDEINSDQHGVYFLKITLQGAYQAQVDPNTSLINSGRYVNHELLIQGDNQFGTAAITWAGGDYYMLRVADSGLEGNLQLLHTNADGRPEGLGGNGMRQLGSAPFISGMDLHWTGNSLLYASVDLFNPNFGMLDADGNPVATFANNGRLVINELHFMLVHPQIRHRRNGAVFRLLAVWGGRENAVVTGDLMIRYALLDRQGNFRIGPMNLRRADGSARHNWFHYIESNNHRSVAAWHRSVNEPSVGADRMHVFINQFNLNGSRIGADLDISTVVAGNPDDTLNLDGESRNVVVAPRPVTFQPGFPTTAAQINNSRRREFGVVWQNQRESTAVTPNPRWQIRFSRINRNGILAATRNVLVIANANHATDPQLVWHSDGYGLAWLEQAPGGGAKRLFFTALDQNGAHVNLAAQPATGAPAPPPLLVGNHQISTGNAEVQDFHMAWNGRVFRFTWVENENDVQRHMQTARAVPRQANQVYTFAHPYHHPTAALVRATLINGATNLQRSRLPNFGRDINNGYGWGRVNLRQSLAPRPPVTFHARDDASVGRGRTAHYRFRLPPQTRLLRVTLNWTDPPGVRMVNNLNLRVTAPNGRVYVGNRWGAAGTPAAQYSDPLPVPPPANPFVGVHTVEQVVLHDAAQLPVGEYRVEVICARLQTNNAFQQFPGQPFALVFVGSGEEFRVGALAVGPVPIY